MSKPFFEKKAWTAAFILFSLLGAAPGASSRDTRRQIEPKELVRTVTAEYAITQAGKDFGSEKLVRREYNDNTIEFFSTVTMSPAEGVNIKIETELLVEADSHFPISHKLKKDILQGESHIIQEIRTELFSNVAVISRITGEQVEVTKKVLPTGAAFVGGNGCYYFYQMLFWYNRDMGGRQTFDVFDLDVKASQPGVLLMTPADDIEVMGVDTAVALYVLEREKRQPTNIYLNKDDVIVRLEQSYMIYQLIGFTEETAGQSN